MLDDKNEDFKKNTPNGSVPGGFVWFLVASFFLALTLQNFLDTKMANVSFSYQLENLVNLQLIQPEDSKKIALNDNLVTFSGKFREKKTEEGKNRFKYLELLNENHELSFEKERLLADLKEETGKALDAANLYFNLTGKELPATGFMIYHERMDSFSGNKNLVLTEVHPQKIVSLPALNEEFNAWKEGKEVPFQENLVSTIRGFRSPVLGIGSEALKQNLRKLETDASLSLKEGDKGTLQKKYETILKDLQAIALDLGNAENGVRLSKLRSVRAYIESMDQLSDLSIRMEENTVKLGKARLAVSQVIWFFNNKEISTNVLEKQDPEKFNQWFLNAKEEWDSFPQNQGAVFKAPDQALNLVLEKTFKSEEPAPNYLSYLFSILPVFIIVSVLYFIFSRQMKGMGGGALSFGKSPAKLLAKGTNKITFKDVAGAEEALEELQEIVDFLKSPEKFTSLGGRIPKGVLCVGPPGTGKTLIAKAVAGEADRPFFSISGSDFVEMFVGVGASRVRDMFDQAKKSAPCIIFMDEIDAVGRHRGVGMGGGHDEREQTLNQLLVEMDGFDTNEGVILMAATNRPDVLDKALLRPGRFDRRVVIGLPDVKGRFEILNVHARKIKLDPNVDLMSIAKSTPGSSGADLANILNEAALLAARRGRSAVTNVEVVEARDKVLYGKERRSLELDEQEKRTTAYHEAGHTVVGLAVKHADNIDKVTIIPRGFSLGSTMFLPKKNRTNYWKRELIDQLAILMGGRAAEELFVGDVSSGAQQDIERATQLARSMVCEWGMSDILGVVAYDERVEGGSYLGGNGHHESKYSQETAQAIDQEVKRISDTAYKEAVQILKEHEKAVQLLTDMLMEFETLDAEDVQKIFKEEWSVEDKKSRLKVQANLQMTNPVPAENTEVPPKVDATSLTLHPST